uniref:WASH_WAHD domain-containing protein n=1 Tax=Angiostrongylus cantonensis TaxID=6313 RepID=A0A158P7V9_ANGCA
MGAEDGSKMKSRRLGKNLKEMNREIRAKLSNINKKPRLHRGLKKVKKLAGASIGKLDNTQKSSSINLPAPPSTLTSTPLTSTNIVSNEKPATKVSTGDGSAEKKFRFNQEVDFVVHVTLDPSVNVANPSIFCGTQMHGAPGLHTRTLRAEDPAVDKLIAGVDESLKAIEALDKIYNNIYQEAKGRTRQLKTEFEHLKALREQIVEYYPDLLSNYSNSSGTISYETIITPRIPEQKELRLASNVDESSDQCYFLREVDLLPPPLIPEVVEWDLVKRFNRLLQVKERNKKTVEVQRTEKGTIEQSKRVSKPNLEYDLAFFNRKEPLA